MAKKTPISAIYTDLVTALSVVIESKYIFLGGRPDTSSESMNKFAVIELPVGIEDIAVGRKKFSLSTTGVVYLFVKAKSNGTLNVNTTSDFVESVCGVFPVNGDYCEAYNPSVLMKGADEYGYQTVSITFDINTKAYVFNEE